MRRGGEWRIVREKNIVEEKQEWKEWMGMRKNDYGWKGQSGVRRIVKGRDIVEEEEEEWREWRDGGDKGRDGT